VRISLLFKGVLNPNFRPFCFEYVIKRTSTTSVSADNLYKTIQTV